jgi:hypothetical protein
MSGFYAESAVDNCDGAAERCVDSHTLCDCERLPPDVGKAFREYPGQFTERRGRSVLVPR